MKRKLLYLFLFVYSFSQAQCFGSLRYPGYTVLPDGTLWYWGYAGFYTGFGFPVGSPLVFMPFNQIGTDSDWSQKYSAIGHQLFIKTNGELWAWGFGTNGQIGNGTIGSQNFYTSPILVSTEHWIEVAGYQAHSLGIKADGTLWAWGRNDVHQLGLNSTAGHILVPTQVGVDSNWSKIFCSSSASLAIKTDGTLWAWGRAAWYSFAINSNGALPQQVGTDTDWIDVFAENGPYFAIKSNGTLWTWGPNPNSLYTGFYGNGFPDTNDYEHGPVQVGTDSDWIKVRSTERDIIGLKLDGTVWLWGQNFSGLLGLGLSGSQFTPQQLGSQTNWVDIGMRGLFYAYNSDGQLYNWGTTIDYDTYQTVYITSPTPYGEPCLLSIKEDSKSDLLIYPNPVVDQLTISLQNTTTEVNKLFIYNSLGQLVLENQFTQNEISIPVSHLANGVYFLRVDHGDGVEQVKFVKR
ncbi:T9SS type A sorting domain-containing protein [Flavobacterium sp.]|jgi:hypothetical protein|uniref:T9SS type A sorting domain-containing protein n=1 Tax=Flavobacterium sp. TaxID=239 RepID=UPI0037BE301B